LRQYPDDSKLLSEILADSRGLTAERLPRVRSFTVKTRVRLPLGSPIQAAIRKLNRYLALALAAGGCAAAIPYWTHSDPAAAPPRILVTASGEKSHTALSVRCLGADAGRCCGLSLDLLARNEGNSW